MKDEYAVNIQEDEDEGKKIACYDNDQHLVYGHSVTPIELSENSGISCLQMKVET